MTSVDLLYDFVMNCKISEKEFKQINDEVLNLLVETQKYPRNDNFLYNFLLGAKSNVLDENYVQDKIPPSLYFLSTEGLVLYLYKKKQIDEFNMIHKKLLEYIYEPQVGYPFLKKEIEKIIVGKEEGEELGKLGSEITSILIENLDEPYLSSERKEKLLKLIQDDFKERMETIKKFIKKTDPYLILP